MQGSVRDAVFPRADAPDRHLRAPWAGVLGVGWIALGVALVVVGATSRQIGKPVWWLGDAAGAGPSVLWLVPLMGPAAAIWASRRTPWWALATSIAASAATVAVALVDLERSPGAGVMQLVLAGAGALLTVAASAGLPTRRSSSASR